MIMMKHMLFLMLKIGLSSCMHLKISSSTLKETYCNKMKVLHIDSLRKSSLMQLILISQIIMNKRKHRNTSLLKTLSEKKTCFTIGYLEWDHIFVSSWSIRPAYMRKLMMLQLRTTNQQTNKMQLLLKRGKHGKKNKQKSRK